MEMEYAGVVASDSGSCRDDDPTVVSTSPTTAAAAAASKKLVVELVTMDEEEEEERLTLDDEAMKMMDLLLLSAELLAMAATAAFVMCLSAEIVLWLLSLLLCCLSVLWSLLLDAGAGSAKAALLFFSGSFSLAAALGDAKMGALLAHLNAHLAAAMVGYALAQRHQRASSAAAAAKLPPDDDDGRRRRRALAAACYVGVVTLGVAARVAWVVVWRRAEYAVEDLVGAVFVPLAGAAMFWSVVLGGILPQGHGGALIGKAGFCLLLVFWGIFGLAFAVVSVRVGGVGAMVFVSIGVLGYSLSVYASFKRRLKLGQLAVKPDESKEESPPRPLLQKQGEGRSKDSPYGHR
ncbi:unnamed protein product [Urochloa humidicola]